MYVVTQKIGQMRYTTNRPVVLVGEKAASDWKGGMATQETPKIMRQGSRLKCRGVSMGLDETHPWREGSAVCYEMESDEAIYQKTAICACDETRTKGCKPLS